MGLGFRYFTCDEDVHTLSNGGFKVTLRPARAPAHSANGSIAVTRANHRASENGGHMVGQGLRAGPCLDTSAHKAQILLAKSTIGLQAQNTGQLGVVAQFGVRIQRQVVSKQMNAMGQ